MRNRRLWIFATGVFAGCVALGVAGVDAGSRAPVHADFNCNSEVDAGDALGLLLEVSDARVGGTADSCASAQGLPAPDGDVNCDGVTNVGDVITITRNIGGLEMLAEDCPYPGDDVGAPLVEMECGPAGESLAVRCRYDVYQAENPIQKQFDGADGVVNVVLETSSVACDPGQVHCQYGYAAELVVTFATPGARIVSITACQLEACATRSLTVWP